MPICFYGCGIGIRSRLRADKTPQNEFCRDPKSGSALNNPTKRVLWGPRVPRTVIHSRPVRIQPIQNKKQIGFCLSVLWLRNRDSNPNKQSQSLPCCRYTIPQYSLHTSSCADYSNTDFLKSQDLTDIFSNI